MAHPLPLVVGVLAALVMGTGVSTAVVRSGNETSSAAVVAATTVPEATTVPPSTTVTGPTTTSRTTATTTRVTTTRAASPVTTRVVPTTTGPVATVAPTTTKPPLTAAAANQGLCKEIEASVRLVFDGNEIGGGLRLLRALTAYGDVADPSIVGPARRMASTGLAGDFEGSAAATREAGAACQRLGFSIILPGNQCLVPPCY